MDVGTTAMNQRTHQGGTAQAIATDRARDLQSIDDLRRKFWRAFQHGELSEDEFADVLEGLEPSFQAISLQVSASEVAAEMSSAGEPSDPRQTGLLIQARRGKHDG